ncbi:peptide chain release factor N(5)-glutamine methyltransferase [Candidatus Woesebacteria bacterium]|nr:peptide chain release factor N(5)-glutamine methyltransferase [Candidatus Woesebacteria bacterium]
MRHLTPYEQTQLARHGNGMSPATDLGTTPIEYVTGVAEFLGLSFFVSPAVLIPRIETEELVELALQTISERISTASAQHPLSIADIGTGSGAISISLAKHCRHFQDRVAFFASDVSEAALAVAKKNAQSLLSPEEPQITFLHSNVLRNYPEKAYDLIIANLPYIPTDHLNTLDASVKDHEPVLALDGGPDGFALIRVLIEEAPQYLTPHGVLLLEIDDSHSIANFIGLSAFYSVEVYKDSFGKNRFAKLTRTDHAPVA